MAAKPIRFSGHAREQLYYRGATEEEVLEAIRTASWEPAEIGRMQCAKDFSFGKEWNGIWYATKRVRPIFAEEATEIVVVTLYTYYF